MGIPSMRVQSGTWGTSKDFDDLMAHRGIEPPLPGHTDEEAFGWTIDAFQQVHAHRRKMRRDHWAWKTTGGWGARRKA